MAAREKVDTTAYIGGDPPVLIRSLIVRTPVKTVFINNNLVAVKGSVSADRTSITQGSRDVFAEGIPVARLLDKTSINGFVETSSKDVLVNGR
jgi:uncharacterized Zn-binding protein involved in type VI secretion